MALPNLFRLGRAVYFIVPQGARIRNVIFYLHGAGWVFGSFHTHEKLVRELSARTNSLVVPEYSRSPEAKYPTAIEQCYFILSHLWDIIGDSCPAAQRNTLTVAGDSVGGNMAIAMALMANMRGGPDIHKLLLYTKWMRPLHGSAGNTNIFKAQTAGEKRLVYIFWIPYVTGAIFYEP